MNKLYLIIIVPIIIITLSSCKKTEKNPSIVEPTVARIINLKTSQPIVASDRFSQSEPAVYFSIKAVDLPKDTKLKAVWKHLEDNSEITSEIITEGTGYEVFTLRRSAGLFPSGKYEVSVTAVVNGQTLEAKGNFSIAEDSKPTHLMNPVTSRSIDNEDKLNPVDVTSEFYQSDINIYVVVQSKELPKNTKVSCIWVYMDSGDSLSHEITTDGNRNIAFILKPDGSQKLPSGKYIVTVSAVINNETESVSREFEIK